MLNAKSTLIDLSPPQLSDGQAGEHFARWASLFSGKIFVNLTVYTDESGWHSPQAKEPGSEAPVFGGYIDTIEEWLLFSAHWQSVLTKYKVRFFHFKEFHRNAVKNHPSSPYYGWSERKRWEFIFELAAAAGNQVPVGGMINLKEYVATGEIGPPYVHAFDTFFKNVQHALSVHWPENTDPITFVLDQNSQSGWRHAFMDEFDKWKQINPKLKDHAYAVSRDKPPLQAADLLCSTVRRGALKRLEIGKPKDATLLEEFLYRNSELPKKKGQTKAWRDSAPDAAERMLKEGFLV
jgi:hypothetical protein